MRAALPTATLLPLSLVALAAGCGNERQHAPRITGIQEPQRATRLAYPGQGISFAAPRNWYQSTGKQPLVSVVASGDATVAVWRYRRKEPIPKAGTELQGAQANLSDSLRSRGGSVQVQSTRTLDVNGVKGIQVVANERIGGQARRVRSTHLFDRAAEIVIDAYAPPAAFSRVDTSVFQPLLRSVRLRAPSSSQA